MSGRGNKRPCPVTPRELEKLYWEENQSMAEIAAILSDLVEDEKPVGTTQLARWMDEAGVNRRDTSAAGKAFTAKHPQERKAQTERMHTELAAARAEGRSVPASNLTRADILKGVAITAANRTARAQNNLACAYCGESFVRPNYRIRPGKKVYCCKHCANRGRVEKRQETEL